MTIPSGIVPIIDNALVPAATTGKVSYHHGHLLTSVQVSTIFWGTGWQQAPQNGVIQQLNTFFDTILTSSLLDLLKEYSVQGQRIGHGQRVATTTITTSNPGTANPDGSGLVTETQIRQALQEWINNHTLPPPNQNTLFFVYLPPNVTLEKDDGKRSCTQICGYHGVINASIFYAVVPFLPCSANCQSGQNQPIDSLTASSSHELCEAITDPDLTSGWYDDTPPNNEIGDLCTSIVTQIGGYTVQQEWSNLARACLASAAVLPQPTALAAGFVWSAESTEHVFYVGVDHHVHELWLKQATGTWNYHDMIANATGSPPNAVAGSRLTGFVWPEDTSEHVFYVGIDSHVHELWLKQGTGSWQHDDVTLQATDAPPDALAGSTLTGFVWPEDTTEHVFYVGVDNHIHELWLKQATGAWQHTDVTTNATGSPPNAIAGSAVTSFVWSAESTEHVFYVGVDHHIHELWLKQATGAWHHTDVTTSATDAPPEAVVGSPLMSFAWPEDTTEHVFYMGADHHVHELWLKQATGAWHHTDVTLQATDAPPDALAGRGLAGFVWSEETSEHVFYVPTNCATRLLQS